MTEDQINLIIHGRGGQGCVTACEIIAEAAYLSGNFTDVHAYPSFGAERRGAPVQAYAKLSRKEKIWDRSEIQNPDILIIFDESVLNKITTDSLKEDGTIIVNSNKNPDYFIKEFGLPNSVKVIVADISTLALEKNLTIDGAPIVNTPILGLLAKSLPDLSIENLKTVLFRKMKDDLAQLNFELIEEGYEMAKIH